MTKGMELRLKKLECLKEDRTPPEPALVIIEDPDGGFNAMNQSFETEDAARAAFPERKGGPCIVVEVCDCRLTPSKSQTAEGS